MFGRKKTHKIEYFFLLIMLIAVAVIVFGSSYNTSLLYGVNDIEGSEQSLITGELFVAGKKVYCQCEEGTKVQWKDDDGDICVQHCEGKRCEETIIYEYNKTTKKWVKKTVNNGLWGKVYCQKKTQTPPK